MDGRSDVFALGVILYEASTGVRPFTADTDFGYVQRLIQPAPPTPPSALVPGYPADLERLVMKALATDPAERITAGELSEGLRALG